MTCLLLPGTDEEEMKKAECRARVGRGGRRWGGLGGLLVRVIDYPSARMTDRWERRQPEIRQGTASHLRFNNNIYIASLK